ncbi:hypothetical protein [Yinghuangia sp. ASG 101]|uniref:hypothetical protein n=1 Tax=Yinghuangia sp. ASG 101 TaxID=2896848 RepID=UPI002F917BC5
MSAGHVRWIAGKMQKTVFGIAWRLAKPRWRIDAHRCSSCGHLELFANTLDRVGVPE